MRSALAGLALLVAASAAPAAGPAKVERPPLRKEPAYVSKDPKYAVLAFGPNAETRVWLVLDLAYDPLREKPGDKVIAYIDRNGDGDLTGPGERVVAEVVTTSHFDRFAKRDVEQHLPRFPLGDVPGHGGKKYTGLTLDVGWFVPGQRYREMGLKVDVPARGTQTAGGPLLRFADKPENAPVIHFDGPLTMRLNMITGLIYHPIDYSGKEAAPPWYEEQPLYRGRECKITAQIGTFGVGAGTFAPITADIPPEGGDPVADVEFPHKDPSKPPITVSVRLTQRCCGTLFNGTVRVPEEAATGKAKVTLGFPVWSLGGVSRGTGEVTVEDPPPEKK